MRRRGAVNRDPEQWRPDASQLDLTRPWANECASFSGGPVTPWVTHRPASSGRRPLPEPVRRFPLMGPHLRPAVIGDGDDRLRGAVWPAITSETGETRSRSYPHLQPEPDL